VTRAWWQRAADRLRRRRSGKRAKRRRSNEIRERRTGLRGARPRSETGRYSDAIRVEPARLPVSLETGGLGCACPHLVGNRVQRVGSRERRGHAHAARPALAEMKFFRVGCACDGRSPKEVSVTGLITGAVARSAAGRHSPATKSPKRSYISVIPCCQGGNGGRPNVGGADGASMRFLSSKLLSVLVGNSCCKKM